MQARWSGAAVEALDSIVRQAVSAGTHAERVAAFGRLVERYADMAFGYAHAVLGDWHLAQDATQDAFLIAFDRLGGLERPGAFPGWLRRVVRTACDRLTRRKQPAPRPMEALYQVAAAGDDPQ